MDSDEIRGAVRRVAVLGNHLPRHCGIATFTTDLVDALATSFPAIDCKVIAMNDAGRRHVYAERVLFEIAEAELASYRRATDFLNVGGFDALSVQHEYGIFGGKAGSHLLGLLSEARMPIVTTLHTILGEPSDDHRRVMNEVTRLSERLIVMSQNGSDLLREVHGVSPDKIDVIPHGVPCLPDSAASRERLGIDGTTMILTFGLLSPDKGIERMIDAMPAILARHPDTTYIVLGATHPHVKEWHGEGYRNSLELRARRLGVLDNVVFHDRFVSAAELGEFLSAADVYVTPYLNPEQITSGTLAYAVGNGKAVVSTPYRYAKELLADGRGILVPWKDASAIADSIIRLLDDPKERAAMGARAAAFGHDMRWPAVAARYVESFERARTQSESRRRSFIAGRKRSRRGVDLPELDLRHLETLTDDTGLIQHALYSVPRREDGYCLDDNARALLLMSRIEDQGPTLGRTTSSLGSTYLAFVGHAFNAKRERFRNFMNYGRQWTEEAGSEDSQARALWALGGVVGRARDPGRKGLASQLFHAALPAAAEHRSPRAWAFSILGIHEYLRAFQGDSGVESLQKQLVERLAFASRDATPDWPWCEDIIAYDNARLPQALIVGGHRLGLRHLVTSGLESLAWLCKEQRSPEGLFAPIGSNGFYRRSGAKAAFDQQPIEAAATVSACLDAWRVTGDPTWVSEIGRAFSWFLGENRLNVALYDATTGGCRDGLHPDRANENQGAESTLSFLLALTDMTALETEVRLRDTTSPGGLGAIAVVPA